MLLKEQNKRLISPSKSASSLIAFRNNLLYAHTPYAALSQSTLASLLSCDQWYATSP